jgi:O-acetyl-ADP-ribose deacetylase (regulator of RNase III)
MNPIRVIQGDMTQLAVDAIVNAANTTSLSS